MTDTLPVVFIIASLVLIITPGQDMILVMSRSISQGPRAGVATAAGVSTGLIGHTLLASLGLGALLMASVVLFTTVKIAGSVYLVYLGVMHFRHNPLSIDIQNMTAAPLKKLYFQGALSNLSNPKIAIFYFAYLPQFVPVDSTSPASRLLLLGTVFSGLTFMVKGPVGFTAGVLSNWLRSRPAVSAWINRISGGVLIALGLKLAFERRG
jgi:threonine/homoserine/homoserine lactone efflux protein